MFCREQVSKLRSEAAELRGLLKEEHATDSKESAESSGESDSHGDLQQTVKMLRSEAKSHRKIIRLLKEQLQQKSARGQLNTELNVKIATEMEEVRTETKDSQRHSQTSEKQVKESKQREKKETQEKEDKPTKLSRSQKQHMARHAVSVTRKTYSFQMFVLVKLHVSYMCLLQAYVKSRLPVPVRPGKSSGQSSEDLSEVMSDHVNPWRRDLRAAEESDYSSDSKTSLKSAHHEHLDHVKDSRSPTDGMKPKGDAGQNMDPNLESELMLQLELLNQECQEKEELISRLQQQVQEWEELQVQLQEKDRINREYLDALQAAESTIAYLTACSLDSECGLGQMGDVSLQQRCAELQKAVDEKDMLNARMLKCLNTAESAITSLGGVDATSRSNQTYEQVDPQVVCERLEDLIRQVRTSQQDEDGSLRPSRKTHSPEPDSDPCRLNAELQQKLKTSETVDLSETDKHNSALTGLEGSYTHRPQEGKIPSWQHQQLIGCLSECIRAAEGAAQSLADVCSSQNQSQVISPNPELNQWLDRLQRALQERESLEDSSGTERHRQKTSTPIQQGQQVQDNCKPSHQQTLLKPSRQNLYNNLLRILQMYTEGFQNMNKLEEGVKLDVRGGGGDAPENDSLERDTHIQSLQKALKERQKACRKLEEKLAIAQSVIAVHGTNKDKQSDRCKGEDTHKHLYRSFIFVCSDHGWMFYYLVSCSTSLFVTSYQRSCLI